MKILRYTGLGVPVLFCIVLIISTHYNPWFVFVERSFSSLGSVSEHGALYPWIYNIGMMTLGALVCVYAVSFVYDSINKFETVAGTGIMVAGVFLALVGIHPMGTSHHGMASTQFFYGTEIILLICGISLLLNEHWKTGIIIIGIELPALLIAIYVNWVSVAVEEAYAIGVITVRVALLTRVQVLRKGGGDGRED